MSYRRVIVVKRFHLFLLTGNHMSSYRVLNIKFFMFLLPAADGEQRGSSEDESEDLDYEPEPEPVDDSDWKKVESVFATFSFDILPIVY